MEFGGFIAFFLILMIAGLAFWIWALIDCVRVPDDSLYKSGTKLVWVLVIVLGGWIGAIIYLAAGRPVQGAGGRQAPRQSPTAPAPTSPVPPAMPPPPPENPTLTQAPPPPTP